MNITRREFLKLISSSALALGLTQLDILGIHNVLAGAASPPVIWLQGSGCSGCSMAALNVTIPTTIDDILLNHVSLKYHPTVMSAMAPQAIQTLSQETLNHQGEFILVVEGGIPTANGGRYCVIGERNGSPLTILDAVKETAPKAKKVLAVGTCASYKGIPGSGSNPTGITPLKDVIAGLTQSPVINLPGCPAPPEIVFGVIVDLLMGTSLTLDREGRPGKYYPSKIHSNCPRRGTAKAKSLGQEGCMMLLGCQGPNTVGDCPNHQFNNKRNWCIGASHNCIGCAAPGFPKTPLLEFGSYI